MFEFTELPQASKSTPPGAAGAVQPTLNVVLPPLPVRGAECVMPLPFNTVPDSITLSLPALASM